MLRGQPAHGDSAVGVFRTAGKAGRGGLWRGERGSTMAQSERGRALTIFAVLFALLAVTNLLKPFHLEGADTGFVFFGQRLSGTANAIVGPLFGLYLLVYAFGIWRMQYFALPMGHAYAVYVILNVILFTMRNEQPRGLDYQVFGVVYATIAIGVSLGAAVILTQRKDELR